MKFLFSLLILVVPAFAHEGPVDGFGCHGSKGGTYHCHSGPLAGRSFVTKNAAVSAFMAMEKEAEASDAAAIKADEAANPKAEVAPKEDPKRAVANKEGAEKPPKAKPPVAKPEPVNPASAAASVTATAPAAAPVPATAPAAAPAPAPVAAAVPAAAPAIPVPPKQNLRLGDLEPLKVVSWSASMMGRDNVDYRQIAHLISYADLVIFEDVSLTDLSREALNQTATALSTAIGEKICRAVVIPTKEAKSRSVMLWKDRKFAFVHSNGRFKETCEQEYSLQDRRSFATLYVKHAKQFITVAPIGKDSDIPAVFGGLSQNQWPAIVAGDFALEYAHPNLKPLRDQRFSPALTDKRADTKSTQRGFQKTLDNLWIRGLSTKDARVVDLAGEYPDVDSDQIRTRFSDRCPVYSEFRFGFDEEAPGKRQPTAEPPQGSSESSSDAGSAE